MGLIQPDLQALTDSDFQARADAAIDLLMSANSAEDATLHYSQQVQSIEAERLRRAAVGQTELDLLFVTVGAQSASPALAVVATPAKFVILLHTDKEKVQAEGVVDALSLSANRAQLRTIGTGTDPLVLYQVVVREWKERRPSTVGIDLTGGLKTMSAAAAAAGFALESARVFYIEAEQPKVHGRTFWVNECRLEMANPFAEFGEIRRQSARALMRDRRFGAAAALFERLEREGHEAPDRFRREYCEGCELVERLEFTTAAERFEQLGQDIASAKVRAPEVASDAVVSIAESIVMLAQGARALERFVMGVSKVVDPLDEVKALKLDECRDFIQMLLCAARRQMVAGQLDVAALLAYRALEAIPQRRLALRTGADPAAFSWDLLATAAGCSVEEFVARYNRGTKKKEHHLVLGALPQKVARAQVYALLAHAFGDGDVARVAEIEPFSGIGDSRNRSLLAHGVTKLTAQTVEKMVSYAEGLFSRMLDVEEISSAQRTVLLARHFFPVVEG